MGIDTNDADEDILSDMGAQNGNFVPPLGPSTYTFWVDEGTGPENYNLNFRVSGIPEPSTSAILMVAAGVLLGKRRRMRPVCSAISGELDVLHRLGNNTYPRFNSSSARL